MFLLKKFVTTSLRISKTAFSPPEMPSESPKVRAEPHGSLLDTRDRVAHPIKDLTPTQSVPPITNIPTPNSQDTPYPKIISSSDYTPQSTTSSNDDRSLVEKNHTTSSISMVCTRWWTDINHIFYHFFSIGNRCTERNFQIIQHL